MVKRNKCVDEAMNLFVYYHWEKSLLGYNALDHTCFGVPPPLPCPASKQQKEEKPKSSGATWLKMVTKSNMSDEVSICQFSE